MEGHLRPRILYVIGGLGAGGAERQLLYLARCVARWADVTVVSLSARSCALVPDFRAIQGVRVIVVDKRRGVDCAVLPRLVSIIRDARPWIVHTYLRTANYWGRVAAMLAGVPARIASERNIEVERGVVANVLDRVLATMTDRIIVNADAIARWLMKVEGIDAGRITVIRNGVAPGGAVASSAVTESRRACGFRETDFLVGFVGRLVRQKNPALVLRAAASLRQAGVACNVLVVGDGPLRRDLEGLAIELGIGDWVRFTGFRRDASTLMVCADVLALTSDWEGLPNVVLEALAAGIPVVGSDVGGVRELITDGENGYLFPPGDLKTLVAVLSRLAVDPAHRATLGANGRRAAVDRFSIERMVTETVRVYDDVLRRKNLGRFVRS